MGTEMKISVIRDGPLLVTGAVPLAEELIACDSLGTPTSWESGRSYPPQENYSLCRCGNSGSKPFCDGSHAETGFRDGEVTPASAYFEVADVIEGPGITLYDHPPLCAKAGFCHRGGNIWKVTATGADAESVQLVIDDANDCPAGRLVAAARETGEAIEPGLEPSISLVEIPSGRSSGPVWVRGGIPIESIDGFIYERRNRVTLCRCGASKNMPFCDATHARISFFSGSMTTGGR